MRPFYHCFTPSLTCMFTYSLPHEGMKPVTGIFKYNLNLFPYFSTEFSVTLPPPPVFKKSFYVKKETKDGLSGFLVCLRICGQYYLLELALKKLNWCHIFHATVMSNYKMKEVLITLPTCLARFPPQLSKELANIRLDSQTVFLLFSSSCRVL